MSRGMGATTAFVVAGCQMELWPGMPAGRCPVCRSTQPAPSACGSCALRAARVVEERPSWAEDRALLTADRRRTAAERSERERAADEAAARWRALGRPVRVALVGCGASKRDGQHPARDLYTGSLFRAALRYAEVTADDVLIVSALHHLIAPGEPVRTYDRNLAAMRKVERLAWGVRVVGLLADRYPSQAIEIVVYAGATYHDPIAAALRRSAPASWTWQAPLAGLSVGRRLGWFKAARDARALATTSTAAAPVGDAATAADVAPTPPASELDADLLLDAHVATRAYAQGFAHGADSSRARRGGSPDAATRAHWLRGFTAGRSAARAAERDFLTSHLRGSGATCRAAPT